MSRNGYLTSRRFWLVVAAIILALLLLGTTAIKTAAQTTPSFSIVSVQRDTSVTIETANFPPNQTFTVTMGAMGTRGVNGVNVGTLDSGAGGVLTATFNIPDQLKGARTIAVRASTAHSNPYFAFNWFYNNTAAISSPTPGDTTPSPGTDATGIPTFVVTGVRQGESVTISTSNFPANQTFSVTMGAMGSRGLGGFPAGTWNSGAGGAQSVTFDIPAEMSNTGRIAIRLSTAHTNPYFAFNWFWNRTTGS